MPWLAVPLHRKATHKKLTRRFQVRQIPMLVLLDAAGKTIHRDITPAVTHIAKDPGGDAFADQFPWVNRSNQNSIIKEMLGETFLKGDGTEVSINELDGKYIGVLLSATWHWQCRLLFSFAVCALGAACARACVRASGTHPQVRAHSC